MQPVAWLEGVFHGLRECRSSMGEVWAQHVRQAGMKLKQNAYVHWYERQGCAREDLVQAVHLMHDAALSYEWCFR